MDLRLNKFLSERGVASRRKADDLIRERRVSVNGIVIEELGTKIDPGRDRVAVDGRPVQAPREHVYVLLHKPPGYLVTLSDPFNRPTVLRLVRGLPEGIRPVGRLDRDSEGVLLLTNDGELAFRLTHPRYEIRKTYVVRVDGEVTAGDAARLAKGVFVEGRKTAPARVEVLESHPAKSIVRVVIHEGRKREVRRMFEAVGRRVAALKRVDFAGLKLEHLPVGEWRHLKKAEVMALKEKVKLA
jgi:23S rRNA pseudouridine2605 synthase